MSAKLFVGNLEYSVTTDQLRDFFSSVGQVVDAVVLVDKMSGRSRGFGFVEYATEEEAQEAIKKFNGADLNGRNINVNEARPPRQDGQANTAEQSAEEAPVSDQA